MKISWRLVTSNKNPVKRKSLRKNEGVNRIIFCDFYYIWVEKVYRRKSLIANGEREKRVREIERYRARIREKERENSERDSTLKLHQYCVDGLYQEEDDNPVHRDGGGQPEVGEVCRGDHQDQRDCGQVSYQHPYYGWLDSYLEKI